MKEITKQEFLDKVESGQIRDVFTVHKRMYGKDYSYDFALAKAGKLCELVCADMP